MAATPKLILKVVSPYEGGTRVWSCGFHFDGANPTDAEWEVLADNWRDAFALCLPDTFQIIESVGYNAGVDVAAFTRGEATDGSVAAASGDSRSPLQTAALIRFATAARSTKGHPVYLFNYVHGPVIGDTTDRESMSSAQGDALITFAEACVTGFSDGVGTRHRAGPNGAVATGSHVAGVVTHRDFPR